MAAQQTYPPKTLPESLREGGLSTTSFDSCCTVADTPAVVGMPLARSEESVCSREDKPSLYLPETIFSPMGDLFGFQKPSNEPITHHCLVSCSFSSFWRWTNLHTGGKRIARLGNPLLLAESTLQSRTHSSPFPQYMNTTQCDREDRLQFRAHVCTRRTKGVT